jgi:hypothetical protein
MTASRPAGPVPTDPRPVPGDGPQPDIPIELANLPANRPSVRPWTVVAFWAVLLGILAAVGGAMGNSAVVAGISGGAAGLVLIVAGVVWLDHRLRPHQDTYRLPVRLGGVFLFAVTAAVAWLALAFGEFMLMLAVIPLAGAVGLEIAARRRR